MSNEATEGNVPGFLALKIPRNGAVILFDRMDGSASPIEIRNKCGGGSVTIAIKADKRIGIRRSNAKLGAPADAKAG